VGYFGTFKKTPGTSAFYGRVMGFKVSVVVVDRAGLPLVMLRGDGAGLHTTPFKLLPGTLQLQNNRTALIEAHQVERVPTDIDADCWHGMCSSRC
jgi:hypothetical protein